MDPALEISLRELVGQEVDADYYDRVRRDVHARGDAAGRGFERDELEGLLPEFGGDAVRRATILALLNRRQEAIALLEGETDSAPAMELLGILQLEDGRCAEVLETLATAQAKHGTSELAALLAEARIRTGEGEGVHELLESAGLDPDGARASYLRGLQLERSGDYAEAIAAYGKACEARPDDTRSHFRRGFLLSLHGDEDEAICAYEACRRTTPVFARALMNLGVLYEDAERYDEAASCYRSVLAAFPGHRRAKMFLEDAEASCDMYYDREKEKERSRRNQLLQIPITDFELSVRSRNCLQKMNIHTLGDLILKTEAELLSYKNFGETSLSEIKRILAQKGFHLGQGDGEGGDSEKDSEQERLLGEPVSVLELSSRSQRCMDRLGIETLGELLSRTEPELISQKNFGVTSLNEVKRKLKERGLDLASS